MHTNEAMSFHRGPLPGEPRSAHYRVVHGTRIRYVDRGVGEPIVMLHGFGSSLDAWKHAAPMLEKDHRVIRLDLKGFGWSDRPPGDYSPSAQAELVLALLDKLGIDEANIVAHSWGSSVALQMALDHPGRVLRLALYDAWAFEEQLPSWFLWARTPGLGEMMFGMMYSARPRERVRAAFHDPRHVTAQLVTKVEDALERPGAGAAALAAVRGQRYAHVQHRYAEIDCPTLLLWGAEDRISLPAFGERLARELPHAQLLLYPNCGHFPMIEVPEASTEDLRRFLRASRP